MVSKGSIIRLDFEAWTDDGHLFDTTRAEVAKKADVHDEKATYEPVPIVAGAGRVVAGLDKALLDAKVGEEREIAVPPREAYGDRDPAKVETVPLREFAKRDLEPVPGERIRYENRVGTIVQVTSGRVRIDYNPPMAGRTLTYKFKIVSEATTPEEKVGGIVEGVYGPQRGGGFGITVRGSTAELMLPDPCKFDPAWAVAKFRIVSDLRTYAAIKDVRFVEVYEHDEATSTTKTTSEPKPEAAGTAATEKPPQPAAGKGAAPKKEHTKPRPPERELTEEEML